MQTTSHFVGVTLDSAQFTDLFVELQAYFRAHNIEQAVELQNPLSLHITLYYLDSSLSENKMQLLLSDVEKKSSEIDLSLSGLEARFFGEPGKERVCYVGCNRNETYESIHRFFAEKYTYSQIPENLLEFVPHISLFRVHDAAAFLVHRSQIEALINKHVHFLDGTSIVKNIELYQVSSLFHPEIQIPIHKPQKMVLSDPEV